MDPHVTHGSFGQPEPTIQRASRSLQLFLQGSWLWQIERQNTLHW